jgi:ligand-binding sensor domain-containing protein/two-component sensor histidine kinase
LHILFLFLICKSSHAQRSDLAFAFANPVFQNYTMKNGLVSNYCYDVLQDKRGYIWVATLNGLCRFNGNAWQLYQQQSAKPRYALPGNWVIDIAEDAQGNIRINTDRGIATYQAQQDSIHILRTPVKGWGKILCQGNRVFVSSWSGIDQYRSVGDSLVHEIHYTGSENNSFMHLYAGADGHVWACPEDNPSLMEIDANSRKMTHHKTIMLDGKSRSLIINAIASYSADTLLLSTKSEGVLKYCSRNQTAIRFLGDVLKPADEFSCALLYKIRGNSFLLAGTKTKGLCCIDLRSHHVYWYKHDQNDPGSLLSDHITALVPDNNEGLWIATSKGLSFFHPSLQKNKYYYFYNNATMPPGVLINAVYKLSDTEFLVGTDQNGLFLHHGVTKETIPIVIATVAPTSPVKVTSFCRLNADEIAVGTNRGLFVYHINSHSIKHLLIGGKPFLQSLFAVKMLEGGKLGLCTGRGAVVYDLEDQKVIYSQITADSSEGNYCKDVFLKGNDLWVLRLFNGYEKHKLSTQQAADLTPKNMIGKPVDYHGFSSASHLLFVATTAGIIVQDLAGTVKAQLLKTPQGLQGDAIENVLYFGNDLLYYTTPEGLYRFHVTQHKSDRIVSYENYPQKWFNQLSLSDDSLLIYTVSDYFMLNDPFFNFKNKMVPKCYVEQVSVNGKPLLMLKDTLTLKHHQNNIVISLAGLVYPESEKNAWYYRCNLPDTSLRQATNGEIVLNNLSPDTYELTIFSVNNEGVRSLHAKKLWLVIRKPFYNTWWFYSILFLLLVLGIYLPFAYRKAQRERLIKIRNQISRDLHDELGSNVSSIHIMAGMLLNRQKNDDDQALRNISRYSVQISDTINDIIWNINPKFDSVDELIKKMVRYASESLDAARINYKVHVPHRLADVEIDNDLKYHIYLLFKEAVNNAAKHSAASLVNISVDFTARVFSFSVKDNGLGFNAGETEKGNGLYNMRSRAKEIKALFTITSAPHEGTEIHLTVKLT